jgi:hypothetical protein
VENQLDRIGRVGEGSRRRGLWWTVSLRRRFWLELTLAFAGAATLLLTLVWHDWFEIVFHVNPDGGDGLLEWLVVGLTGAFGFSCSALARRDWCRSQAEPAV